MVSSPELDTRNAEHAEHAEKPSQKLCALTDLGVRRWGLKTLGELAALTAGGPGGAARPRRWGGRRSRAARTSAPWCRRGRGAVRIVDSSSNGRSKGSSRCRSSLTRLLEPLSTRLERRDRGRRGAARALGLRHAHGRSTRGGLRAAVADARRAHAADLALLDLEAHPPPPRSMATPSTINPTPGRVLQHTLFTRAHPTPEQTIDPARAARCGAWARIASRAAASVDSYRPGAFAMRPFATEHNIKCRTPRRREPVFQNSLRLQRPTCQAPAPASVSSHERHLLADGQAKTQARRQIDSKYSAGSASSALTVVSALNVVSALRRRAAVRRAMVARRRAPGDHPRRRHAPAPGGGSGEAR